ncbi:MAG: hypothetical protein KKD73_13465 [Proteobacteria bacterium]|nr:hypothetical protein [Pseudomonadota bacterium]MBU1640119.1 hypothetical protein [Pseudomonadota bacterium]
MKLQSVSSVLTLIITFFLSTGTLQTVEAGKPSANENYTTANIWYQQPKIWSSNFKVGAIIPAGSKVSGLTLLKGRHQAIEFTTTDNKTYWIYLAPKYDPGLAIGDVQKRLFGSKNFSELTRGLSSSEVTAIKQGRIEKGMSKAAVLISWGYPPTALTPSPKADKWTYWKNRFDKQNVFFDAQGKVTDIVD